MLQILCVAIGHPPKAIPITVHDVHISSCFAQSCVRARGEISDTSSDTLAIPICSKSSPRPQIDPFLSLSFPFPFPFLFSRNHWIATGPPQRAIPLFWELTVAKAMSYDNTIYIYISSYIYIIIYIYHIYISYIYIHIDAKRWFPDKLPILKAISKQFSFLSFQTAGPRCQGVCACDLQRYPGHCNMSAAQGVWQMGLGF